MKMLGCAVVICGLVLGVLMAAGCSRPSRPGPTVIAAGIQTGASAAGYAGLVAYGKKHPGDAHKVAQAVSDITGGTVLPYIEGAGTAVASSALNDIMRQQFAILDPEARALVAMAAGALDAFLPAPAPGTYLTAEQVGYLKAFFSGLKAGADAYLAGDVPKASRVVLKRGAWLRD